MALDTWIRLNDGSLIVRDMVNAPFAAFFLTVASPLPTNLTTLGAWHTVDLRNGAQWNGGGPDIPNVESIKGFAGHAITIITHNGVAGIADMQLALRSASPDDTFHYGNYQIQAEEHEVGGGVRQNASIDVPCWDGKFQIRMQRGPNGGSFDLGINSVLLMRMTWEDAARVKLHRSQLEFSGEIAEAAGGPIGYRMEREGEEQAASTMTYDEAAAAFAQFPVRLFTDRDIVAVPGVTQKALEDAIEKFPVATCKTYCERRGREKVNAEAARRIRESGLPWMVEREISGGKPVPEEAKAYAAAVREASNRLEAEPPDDPQDDRHWPERPGQSGGASE